MKNAGLILFFIVIASGIQAQPSLKHNLVFDSLATSWDEAIPLGNGMLGALVWEKQGQLRFSLDRADLWDQRPMKGTQIPEFRYKWIQEQIQKNNYGLVQKYMDEPYSTEAAPSKIPGAALEIDIKNWGPVERVQLDIATAVCTIKWKNGTILETFIHADKLTGWFRISNLNSPFSPQLIAPSYQADLKSGAGNIDGDDLNRLGYPQGKIIQQENNFIYSQKGWGGFSYEVAMSYKKTKNNIIEGAWSISSSRAGINNVADASSIVKNAMQNNYAKELLSHEEWWKNYWSKSSVQVPDAQIEKQYYLEIYKFGAASRPGAPPISLQAVWTADNGRLPPWKGDFHHDLNTQLSYWPSYSSNHLEEGMPYYDHLDQNKENYLKYTHKFFETEGLNVPGVTTLDGDPMGGWIAYSGSATVSSWLAQHFYLQWRYSMDREFLEKRAYPWISETARFIENITVKDDKGMRKLPLSSSPEIFDNKKESWFTQNTNYDLALMKFVIGAAKELALELNKKEVAEHWSQLLSQFPEYSLSANHELMFAPGKPYDESHRHFSNLMAIHPLGLIKWEDGDSSRMIIKNSIKLLDSIGPSQWCGYSYSWLANLKARAKDGEGAAKALRIFAKAFCLKNSFHANGDQTKSGYSNFTYRPFTLEGNFAYAAGLQEMLIQSYAGFIEVFPAVPSSWKDISFSTLRTEGAFLVDAKKENGKVKMVKIFSEKENNTILKLPFSQYKIISKKGVETKLMDNDMLMLSFSINGEIILESI